MRNSVIIQLGKTLSKVSKYLNLGNGSTWPGHLALKANPFFARDILKNSRTKVIIVAGTNGKTTTTKMIKTILEHDGKTVVHNSSGANLLNGIASTLLLKSHPRGTLQADYAVFEVDENALSGVLKQIQPDYLILLNLFRDQLDRYGEIETIVTKWRESISQLPETTTLLLNADDPQVAYLGHERKTNVIYFGLDREVKGTVTEHSADSLYCPNCHEKLHYHTKTYSHLGNWFCQHCKLKRPKIATMNIKTFPLSGTYNEYNTYAAVLLVQQLQIKPEIIAEGLSFVKPAFGRQEILKSGETTVQIFLSKNPTGFNESLRTVTDLQGKHLLLALNDRAADGNDVSWIWDIDFESFIREFEFVTITGDRAFDMGLRIKYSGIPDTKYQIQDTLETALSSALDQTPHDQTLSILSTYTAMLEIRKILSGRSIL